MVKCVKGVRPVVIGLGMVLILNVVFLLPLMNPNAGLLLAFGMGLLLIFIGMYLSPNRIRSLKGFNIMLTIALILVLGLTFGSMVWIYIYGQIDTISYTEDAIIILGAGLRGDAVSLTLKHRLDTGYAYYLKNPSVLLIVSGGQGQGESVTEAYAMADYLIGLGVPDTQISLEERSTSTYENFVFSKAILDSLFPEGYSVAFVSNDFHLLRSHMMAKSVGLKATHIGAKLDYYLLAVTYLREVLALTKWFVLNR